MAIPLVSEEDIRKALARFDLEFRGTHQWLNWQEQNSHKYAIKDHGQLYPVKQIIALATGLPTNSFGGGRQANSYLRERGFEVDLIRLPSEIETATALHELIIESENQSIKPADAYAILADRFQIPAKLLQEKMPDGRNHWENRVQYARRKLVSDDILDGSEPGVWKLKKHSEPRVWIEKTLVANHPDRLQGEYALGQALWSPQRDRSDGDEYWAMREVQPGDLVIHLVDNQQIVGVSKVKSFVSTEFQGLPGTPWAGLDAYLIQLEDFKRCDPPLRREAFLGNPALASDLHRIRAAHKHLFYDRDLNLNQGRYLTPAPQELVALLNATCLSATGKRLPIIMDYPFLIAAPDSVLLNDGQRELLPDPATQRVWLYSPGEDAEHWDEFYREGIIAIGWDELGDLSAFHDQAAIEDKIKEVYEREASPTNDARCCYEFSHVMRPGDFVFVKRGRSKVVGCGTILGDYRFDSARENYQNLRRIRWEGRGLHPSERSFPMKTLTDVTNDSELVDHLRSLFELDSDEDAPEVAPLLERTPFSVDEAINGLFIEKAEFEKILSTWRSKRNLIIQGPPGVGKTFMARRLAFALMRFKDPSRVGVVQFHQSYGYEDFVQGYRPTPNGLALKDGLFLEFCHRAARDLDTTYVFIIDEINRGNLSRIFGELMMLIEADKRNSGWSVPLTYASSSEAQFFVPENVFLLGLMNTADRSLAMVDYALRRRFAFYTMGPQIGSPGFRKMLADRGIPSNVAGSLVNCIENLNKKITDDKTNLGAGYRVGHSYFCQEIPESVEPMAWLKGVIDTEIVPLLAEYWIDDQGQVDKWASELSSIVSS